MAAFNSNSQIIDGQEPPPERLSQDEKKKKGMIEIRKNLL